MKLCIWKEIKNPFCNKGIYYLYRGHSHMTQKGGLQLRRGGSQFPQIYTYNQGFRINLKKVNKEIT